MKNHKLPMVKSKTVDVFICPNCSYEWTPRTPTPGVCPRCKKYFLWHKKEEASAASSPAPVAPGSGSKDEGSSV